MYRQFKDRVAFLFVYIREAHPRDEWQLDANKHDRVVFDQPTTLDERCKAASGCTKSLSMTFPCVVDDMNNTADNAYAGWPERLYVIDTDGRIAFAGGQGPFGFEPSQVSNWLRRNLGPSH